MAGVVEKVMVKVGDAVKAGDVLALVSAMKMEVKHSCMSSCSFLYNVALGGLGKSDSP